MAQLYKHLLLTRFNVQVEGWPPLKAEWHTHRARIFESVCLPSIVGQTTKMFSWLVFFDKRYRTLNKSVISACEAVDGFIPIEIDFDFSFTAVRPIIRAYLSGAEYWITTRVDNDDALISTYVEILQSNFEPSARLALNFPEGFVLSTREARVSVQPCNPFVSLVESSRKGQSVWMCDHLDISKYAPVKQIDSGPSWVQFIHSKNKCNQLQGHPVKPEAVEERFPHLLDRLARIRTME